MLAYFMFLFLLSFGLAARTTPRNAPSDACAVTLTQCGKGTNYPSDYSACCNNNVYVYCHFEGWILGYRLKPGVCGGGLQCEDSSGRVVCHEATG